MSEETNAFPFLQIGTFVKGDQWVFRGDNAEDFAEDMKLANEHAETIVTALSGIKEVAVAKGIFTGDSNGGGSGSKPATRASGGAGKARATDKPPPRKSSTWESYEGDDGRQYVTIECDHGPMLDLRKQYSGKQYKADFYCSLDTDNYKDKCKPVSA
jgi:hypothetical protein